MIRHMLASLALTLPLAAAQAHAAQAPFDKSEAQLDTLSNAVQGGLSDRAARRAAEGGFIPVIVMLEMGAPASGQGAFAGVDAESRAQIASAREQVLQRAFPGGVARQPRSAAAEISDSAGPVVHTEFTVTPAFAMLADADTIRRLAQTEGVAAVREDTVSTPILNETAGIVGAPALWAQGIEGSGVSVAILDTGVEIEHPMTAPAISASACFNTTVAGQSTSFCNTGDETTNLAGSDAGDSCVEDNISASGVDGCFHGTHVGSTAAGRTVNTSSGPISGIARQSNIIAVNVFSRFIGTSCRDDIGPCVLSYNSDQLAALEWLFTNRVALNLASINMSLGGGENSSPCAGNSLSTVIGQLRAEGIATVIASGNDGFTDAVGAPSCIPDAITVGATDNSDAVASFSNSDDQIDLLAPGVSVFAAFQSEQPNPGDNCTLGSSPPPGPDGFCHWFSSSSGTSMATPHVAGAFALLRGAFPGASVTEIETALEFTGVQVVDSRNSLVKPRIQVDAARNFLNAGGAIVSDVQLTPVESFAATGQLGDPAASFGSKIYTLQNNAGASRSFTLAGSESWIQLSSTSGAITAGNSTQFTVSVDPAGLAAGGYSGGVTLTVSGQSVTIPVALVVAAPPPPPPANNNFADALPLAGPSPSTTGTNVGSDKETGEPNHGTSGGASVWWRWTAPFSATMAAATEGSSYDTALGVYTGNAVNSLTQLGGNDDVGGGNLTSRVEFAATAGETYFIAVDGFGGATGDIALALAPTGAPGNDNFANAEAISAASGSTTGHLVNSTRQAGEPNFALTNEGSIWYTWTAPSAGTFRFALDGTNGPATIGAYSGPAVDGLTQIATAEDTTRNGQTQDAFSPSLEVTVGNGDVVHLAIGRTAATTTGAALSWTRSDLAVNLFSAVLPYARSVQVGSTATAFVSIYNDGAHTATNCRVEGPGLSTFPGEVIYQTTNPATNELSGTPNTPADIASGQTQTYVFGITPYQPIDGLEIAMTTRCDNAQTPIGYAGVNTFILNAEAAETPDLIAIAATITANGIVEIPSSSGVEVFTVAAVNIGAAGDITATPLLGGLPATATICETGPGGACLQPAAANVSANFAANETRFFSIFITASSAIAFDPANNRARVLFQGSTAPFATYGGTNVAVRTP